MSAAPARPSGQTLAAAAIVAATLGAVGGLLAVYGVPTWDGGASPRGDGRTAGGALFDGYVPDGQVRPARFPTAEDRSALKLADIPFDGAAAYEHLKRLCALGPRTSGSRGMAEQQKLLSEHFRKLGAKVEMQRFQVRHPVTRQRVTLANMIVTWHPARKERLLVCTHYDTRPFPDRDPDPRRRRGVFLGANDGASGTALLMQLAHAMPSLDAKHGVDFVLFDGEEFVFDEDRDAEDYYFLGSRWFAEEYVRSRPAHRYVAGVLLDMVGDANLELYPDRGSLARPAARKVADAVWSLARQLNVREFIAAPGHEIRDDHLPLNDVAGIPTCDLIDFDYPRAGDARSFWHTTEDKPDNCSALSLAKVGWVVAEWIQRAP